VIAMLRRVPADVHDWTTVYEDDSRRILARGEERRAIDSITGKIIIEYRL
jgi:hypothetical protein